MISLIRLFSNNIKFCWKKICNRIVIEFWKWGPQGIGIALCFTFLSLPAFATCTGKDYLCYSPGTGTPIFRMSIMLIELIVLGINSQFIMSDMRVIRWFEEKKKRRL